jgi:hypothetical protein
MELIRTPSFDPKTRDSGAAVARPTAALVAVMWVLGAAVFALVLTVGFLGYTNPAMLIEFASLRLCG